MTAGGWRTRFGRRRGSVAAAVVLAVLALGAVVGPTLVPYGYAEIAKSDIWSPPLVHGHLLGTDALGRDLLARLLAGLRVSLAVGLCATAVALAIGVTYGAIAGYAGGRTGELMMRGVDVLYALPFLFFVVILTVTFGHGIATIFVAIGAVEWLTTARIVRAQTLALRDREFVEAARAIGVSPAGIVVRHIVPNLLAPVAAYATLTVPSVIIAESFLSFLGLGVQDPLTSLGTLIADGTGQMEIAPWLLAFPALVMVALLLAFNRVGDGLRAALGGDDPA